VDLLERVEVDEQDPEVEARARVARESARQLIDEHLAIRQSGQRVAADAGLEPDPLRDVLGRGVPVLALRAAAPQQPAPAAVAVAVASEQFDEAGLPAVRSGSLATRRGRVVRMQAVQQRLAEQLILRAAEDPLAGGVDRDEARLPIEDREQAPGEAEELLEGLGGELGVRVNRRRLWLLGSVGDQPERHSQRAVSVAARPAPYESRQASIDRSATKLERGGLNVGQGSSRAAKKAKIVGWSRELARASQRRCSPRDSRCSRSSPAHRGSISRRQPTALSCSRAAG